MDEIRVLAGVVTYNPEYNRLLENLSELAKQVRCVVIVDNGSENIDEVVERLPVNIREIMEIIYNKDNEGIAKALSQIMDFAKKQQYDWVITLDQDSIIEPYLINMYSEAALKEENQDVAMFTCLIKDRNFEDLKYEVQDKKTIDVPYCITSAAFTNVQKYFETSGYDVNFFIDCVDFDICYLLREKGYRISRINFIGLYHEVGHGENRLFLGKQIVIYHQAPFRIYYLARNTILMHRKHRHLYPEIVMLKKLLALWIRILFYENDRSVKMKQFWKGIKDSRTIGE